MRLLGHSDAHRYQEGTSFSGLSFSLIPPGGGHLSCSSKCPLGCWHALTQMPGPALDSRLLEARGQDQSRKGQQPRNFESNMPSVLAWDDTVCEQLCCHLEGLLQSFPGLPKVI